MKALVLLYLCAVASAAMYESLDENRSSSFTEQEDLKERLDCYLDKGPCDPVSLSYKKHMMEGMREKCAKCTEGQKRATYTFNLAAAKFFPQEFKEFLAIYDPDGSNYEALMEAVKPKA